MTALVKNTGKRRQQLMRSALLVGLAASIVGIGCATIRIPPPKDETAEKVYLPAAKAGNVARQLQLALAYRYGTAGVTQSNTEALAWLGKAATGGSVQAQLMLGDAYLKGEMGLEKQPAIGIQWLRKPSDNGSTDAQFYLANVLEQGIGVPASPSEAASLYEKAARSGHKFAAWRLARLLERDLKLADAQAWYRVSGSPGDAERLRLRMRGPELKAAEERYAVLMREMGK